MHTVFLAPIGPAPIGLVMGAAVVGAKIAARHRSPLKPLVVVDRRTCRDAVRVVDRLARELVSWTARRTEYNPLAAAVAGEQA